MFEEIKKTVKQTAVYSLGNISTKIVGFILLPLYTKYLLPEEFGTLVILQIILQILVGVFGFNLPTSMMRWYAEQKNKRDKKSVVFTTFFATTLIAIVLSLILIPFSSNFSFQIFSTTGYSTYFVYLFLAASFGILSNVPLNVIRLKELPIFYVVLSLAKFTSIVVCNIYFVTKLNMGVEGIMLSELIGALIVIVVSFPIIIKNSNFILNLLVFRKMFLYGAPLIFSTVFSFILTLGDRFIIKYFYGLSSVGIYSIGHKVASVINMLILQSFQLGFLPIAYKKLGSSNEKRFFSKILTLYTTVLSFAALGLSLFGKELIETFTFKSEYFAAYTVVPIIAYAFVIKGIQYNFALCFHYAKRTKYVAYILFTSAFVNIILNIILVKFFGFIGAAYGFLTSIILMMMLSYYYGQKVYKISFELLKMFKIVSISLFLYLISLLVLNQGLMINVVVKILLVILFPLILYKGSIFDQNEIDSLNRRIKDFKMIIGRKNKNV